MDKGKHKVTIPIEDYNELIAAGNAPKVNEKDSAIIVSALSALLRVVPRPQAEIISDAVFKHGSEELKKSFENVTINSCTLVQQFINELKRS